jgi:hypothetical protein
VLLPPGAGRSRFGPRVIAAYFVGTCSGAIVSMAGAWLLSGLAEPLQKWQRTTLLVTGALLIGASKGSHLSGIVRLPEARRQIPSRVLHGGLIRGAYRFGFELGTGVRTYLPSPAPYIVLLVVLLAGPTLGQALLIAIGFGLGRGWPLLATVSTQGRERMTQRFLAGVEHVAPGVTTGLVLIGGLALV